VDQDAEKIIVELEKITEEEKDKIRTAETHPC
jgi:hypothetical protein